MQDNTILIDKLLAINTINMEIWSRVKPHITGNKLKATASQYIMFDYPHLSIQTKSEDVELKKFSTFFENCLNPFRHPLDFLDYSYEDITVVFDEFVMLDKHWGGFTDVYTSWKTALEDCQVYLGQLEDQTSLEKSHYNNAFLEILGIDLENGNRYSVSWLDNDLKDKFSFRVLCDSRNIEYFEYLIHALKLKFGELEVCNYYWLPGVANRSLQYSNSERTVYNNTNDWINVGFIGEISSGMHRIRYQIDHANPSTTFDIGVVSSSEFEQVKRGSYSNVRNQTFSWLYSWNSGNGSILSGSESGTLITGYQPQVEIDMILDMNEKTLVFERNGTMLCKFVSLSDEVVPIASLAPVTYNVKATILNYHSS